MYLSKKMAAVALALGLTVTLSACGGSAASSGGQSKPIKSLSEAKDQQTGDTTAKESKQDSQKETSNQDSKKDSNAGSDKNSGTTNNSGSATELHPLLQEMVDQVNSHDILNKPEGQHLLAARAFAEPPGTFIYQYVLKPIPDPAGFAANMDKAAETELRPVAEQIKKQMAANGIQDPKVIYRYLLNDGSVAWERTF